MGLYLNSNVGKKKQAENGLEPKVVKDLTRNIV